MRHKNDKSAFAGITGVFLLEAVEEDIKGVL